jgi:hypothetical protein
MKAIRYRFFNIVSGKPMSTVYTALVKPGQTFFDNPDGVEFRRCKEMIVREGDISLQPRRICKHSDGKWSLVYGWPQGRSWSRGSMYAPINVIEIITLNDTKMDREKLKTVAGYYFKENLGAEPDALRFTYEEHDVQEFSLEATFGKRTFEIWMLPLHNRIELTEKTHKGSFADAAEIAGYDRNLENIC